MNITNFWTSSGTNQGGGGGDPGEAIGASIRIRTADNSTGLRKNDFAGNTPTQWTVSYWMKLGRTSTAWNTFGSLASSYYTGHGYVVSGNQYTSWALSTSLGRTLRDYGAWYHMVHTFDNANSRNYRVYVNGELTLNTNITWPANPNFMVNGGTNYIPQVPAVGPFEGYLAAFHALDGQVLQPTSFGRTNASGVWVPRTPVRADGTTELTSEDYGRNGFHLDFHDPLNIGEDVAPTGTGHTAANNFTASGMDTAPVGVFSDMLVPPANGYEGPRPPTAMFDGNIGTWAQVLNNADVLDFRPTTPIAYNTLEYYTYGATWTLTQDDDTVTTGGDQSIGSQWASIATTPGTIQRLTFANTVGTPAVAAIRLNGTTILIDNTGTNYDVMTDSPTNNFATLNAALPWYNQTLSNANLTGGGTSSAISLSSQVFNNAYYWEAVGSPYYYGIAANDTVRNNYLGYEADQVGWFKDGTFWISSASQGSLGTSFTTTDLVMQAYDPATGRYWVGKNGTWHNNGNPANGTNPAYTVPAALRARMVPASNVSTGTNSYNFGQRPFIYAVPEGFEPLNTDNMTASTIPNGRDHFRVVTAAGGDVLTDARGVFATGLWWVKDRANANQHQLVDNVRGNTRAIQSPAIVTEQAYANPAGNSVAWCWNYNADDPSINGFDIVTYVGNGTDDRQIDHDLDAVPQLMIVKNRDEDFQTTVYHNSTGSTQYAFLNTSAAFAADSSIWSDEDPTTTQFTVGNNILTNGNGDNMVAYLWSEIPGYSAFGSYVGNATANDGPFIYTGFRPAFVMIKSSNNTYQWMIVDSTRNVTNPVNSYLFPNLTNAEQTASTFDIDFLSNGFKPKSSTATDNNASGTTYVYAAFAENPFQSPVTAR